MTNAYRLILATLSLYSLMAAGTTRAAEITHRTIVDDIEGIMVVGEIKSSDAQKFREFSIKYKRAVVILSSNGGSLLPAIEIGKIIKIARYITVVPDEAVCASSCALIWVAGETRLLSPNGRVGFHASYRDNNGRLEESGTANALIGSYLTLLNLPERAVVFATRASPDKILWLTSANKASAGIDFDDFDVDEIKAEERQNDGQTVAPVIATHPKPQPVPLPIVRLAPPKAVALPEYLPSKLSMTGEQWAKYVNNAYYDANSVPRSIDTRGGSARNVWVLVDWKNQEDKRQYSLVLWHLNCTNFTEYVEIWEDHYKDGKIGSEAVSSQPRPIRPGTAEKMLLDRVCS